MQTRILAFVTILVVALVAVMSLTAFSANAGGQPVWIDAPDVVSPNDSSPITITVYVSNNLTETIAFYGSVFSPRQWNEWPSVSQGTTVTLQESQCRYDYCTDWWSGTVPSQTVVSFVVVVSPSRIPTLGFSVEATLSHPEYRGQHVTVPYEIRNALSLTPIAAMSTPTVTATTTISGSPTPTSTPQSSVTTVATAITTPSAATPTSSSTPDYTYVSVNRGWTLLALPSPRLRGYTAASLLRELDDRCLRTVQIARWQNGGWQSFIPDFPVNDFPIEPGMGYFVKTDASGVWDPFRVPSPPLGLRVQGGCG